MDSHEHLLMQQKIVDLGMFVKHTFLLGFLDLTVLHCGQSLLGQICRASRFVCKQMSGVHLSLGLETSRIDREAMHELERGRTNG